MRTIILSYATLSLITLLVYIWYRRKSESGITLENLWWIIILSIFWPVNIIAVIYTIIMDHHLTTIIPSYSEVQKRRKEKKRQRTGFDI